MMDLYHIVQYLTGRCHGNQIICEPQVQHGQKTGVFLSNISGYTGPIFAIFSPYENSLCTYDGSILFFPNLVNFRPYMLICTVGVDNFYGVT